MIIIFSLVVAVLTVPLAGGRLSRVADLNVRHGHLAVVAVGLQTVLVLYHSELIPGWVTEGLHLFTYVMAFAFAALNRHVHGLFWVVLGAVANALAIAANGGVMPSSAWATQYAGLTRDAGFNNSDVLVNPRLLPLGDVFAIPAGWPLANVFSIGDVLLVIGAGVLLHRAAGSRLVSRRDEVIAVHAVR